MPLLCPELTRSPGCWFGVVAGLTSDNQRHVLAETSVKFWGMVSGGRILLIDDDESFRRLVHVLLTAAGYDVQDAADGKIGFASYRRQRSDVVITDILMPESEGLETIRALKELDPDVRIIAMSAGGEGRLGYLETAVAFGARRVLHKPFTRDELLSTVADVLAG